MLTGVAATLLDERAHAFIEGRAKGLILLVPGGGRTTHEVALGGF
jgi:hypothetical protein